MSASGLATHKLTDRLSFLALVTAVLAYLYFRFEKLIQCPSCYLFSDGGDGLKNYFTPAWYVHHDKGLWFHGMNYPYGEHPVYTDNQPIWSLAMKLVNLVFPMRQHITGTINMLLLASLAIGVIAVYGILREFKLPKWYAALVSMPIVFLSPQLERFNGHYSLAYICYIPVFLLLFIRWIKYTPSAKSLLDSKSIALLLWIVWTGFTHLYFFFISVAFMMAYFIVLWVKKRFKWKFRLSQLLAVILLAGIAVYLPVKLTDPVKDRPKEAYGIYVFSATPAGTFLPWYGEWTKTWTEKYQLKAPDFESKTYIGIAAVLLMPFILFYGVRNLVVRRERKALLEVPDASPGVIAWAGILVWIMATGWFYMAGGSVLVEAFPVLGQFRSLGRLSWIFYFAMNCFAAWYAYTAISSLSKKWLRIAFASFAAILFVVWIYEAHMYAKETTQHIYRHNHIFRGDKPFLGLLQQKGLQPGDFQAILQVPLIIIGTENLPVHRGHWEFNNTLQCAWETGLPIVNYNMSRTSVRHALSLLQLISTPDISKVRLEDMNEKPLLLTSHIAQLLPTEQRLIDLAEPIGKVGEMGVYKLSLDAFTSPIVVDSLQRELVVEESFESTPSEHTFEGNGSHTSVKDSVYFSFTDTSSTSKPLIYSHWVYLAREIAGFPAVQVKQYGPDNVLLEEQVHSIHSFNPWQVKGQWVEMTFPMQTKVKGSHYDFSLLSSDAVIDHVVIQRE